MEKNKTPEEKEKMNLLEMFRKYRKTKKDLEMDLMNLYKENIELLYEIRELKRILYKNSFVDILKKKNFKNKLKKSSKSLTKKT